MSKKTWTDRLGDFVAGKGFYIVLFLCIAAIGISGYYLFSTLGSGTEDTTASGPVQVTVTPVPATTPVPTPTPNKPVLTPVPSAEPVQEAEVKPAPTAAPSAAPTPTPTAAPAPSAAAAAYVWPVEGEIIRDFSLEVLAYDETMGDWRTHCGLDISAELGSEVCAVSAGTVEAVYEDDLMGTTVVIDHGEGVKSLYANLAADPTAVTGDSLKAGTVIGTVGETALAESGRPPHLHFEMSRNDRVVDPLQYLP